MLRMERNAICTWTIGFAVLASAAVSAGCATTGPHLYNETDLIIRAADGENHAFATVRAYRDGDEIVLYGTVDHHHEHGAGEGHVDLAIADATGRTEHLESLPLRWTGAKQRGRGWDGAEFRTRFRSVSTSNARSFLAFHKGDHVGSSGDCGQNRAAALVSSPGEGGGK